MSNKKDIGPDMPLWLWVAMLMATAASMIWQAVTWPFRKAFGK